MALTQLKLNKFNLSYNRLEGKVPSAFDNKFFYSSLMGNPGLCSSDLQDFPSCRKSKPVSVYLVAILASCAFILVVSLLWLLIKTRKSSARRKRNGRSWSSTAFQPVRLSESDVLASLSDENVIATGGSGRVFRVQLKPGSWLQSRNSGRLTGKENPKRYSNRRLKRWESPPWEHSEAAV